MLIARDQLKKLLLGSGIVNDAEWNDAVYNADRRRRDISDVLIERGVINSKYLYEIVSDFLRVPFVDLKREKIDVKALEILSEEEMIEYKAVPFKQDKKNISIAFLNPGDKKKIQAIEAEKKIKIIPYLTNDAGFLFAIRQKQKNLSDEIHAIIDQYRVSRGHDKNLEQVDDYPIATIIDTILSYSVISGTSDIHIEPLSDALLVRFRIDGNLRDMLELPVSVVSPVLARLKSLAGLKINEKLIAQDGRFIFRADDESIFVRLSILPTFYGEKAVMRLFNEHQLRFNLEDLGLSTYSLDLINKQLQKSSGLILVVGPTGSGKSTTLYTALNILNTEDSNISTIEDPIEYGLARVNQTQVNPEMNYTFASGLRALLRQDPDVIMVGEIRDDETAQVTVHASLTGHLVLSTMHTNTAIDVIPRMVDLGIKPLILASTLSMVVAQRLVRKICLDCIESYRLTEDQINGLMQDYKFDKVFSQMKKRGMVGKGISSLKDLTLYRGVGCEHCHNSGYSGRVGIYEVLVMSDVLRSAITSQALPDELSKKAEQDGFVTLFEDGWSKAMNGVTTIEEILAHAGGIIQ